MCTDQWGGPLRLRCRDGPVLVCTSRDRRVLTVWTGTAVMTGPWVLAPKGEDGKPRYMQCPIVQWWMGKAVKLGGSRLEGGKRMSGPDKSSQISRWVAVVLLTVTSLSCGGQGWAGCTELALCLASVWESDRGCWCVQVCVQRRVVDSGVEGQGWIW